MASGEHPSVRPDRLLGTLVPGLSKASPRSPASGLHTAAEQISRDLAAYDDADASFGPQRRQNEIDNEPSLRRFKASVDRLRQLGWSWEKVARFLGCARQTVMGVYEGHPYVPARYLDKFDLLPELNALPARMRAQQLKKVG